MGRLKYAASASEALRSRQPYIEQQRPIMQLSTEFGFVSRFPTQVYNNRYTQLLVTKDPQSMSSGCKLIPAMYIQIETEPNYL